MRLCEADAMDVNLAAVLQRTGLDRLSPAVEQMHVLGKGQFPGDLRLRIVVATNEEDADVGGLQPAHLPHQEQRRRHGGLRSVIEVARDDDRIHPFGDGEVDDALQRLARRPAHEIAEVGIAQGKRGERRIEMQVGRMEEAERHGRTIAFAFPRVNACGTGRKVMQEEIRPCRLSG